MDAAGREEVITAATADLRADADGKNVTMLLRKGQRIGVWTPAASTAP